MSGPAAADLPLQLITTFSGQPAALGLPPTATVPLGADVATVTAVVPAGASTGSYTITASADGVERSAAVTVSTAAAPGTLRLVATMPKPAPMQGSIDPVGDETQAEQVHIRNEGLTPVPLAGWRIANPAGEQWGLDNFDGSILPLRTSIVTRQGRPM